MHVSKDELLVNKNCTGFSLGGKKSFHNLNILNIYGLFDCSVLGEVAIADDLLLSFLHTDILEI